jgi:hypothetical protein
MRLPSFYNSPFARFPRRGDRRRPQSNEVQKDAGLAKRWRGYRSTSAVSR